MECSAIPAKVIASCFGLMAFAAAIVVGWSVDNSTQTILWRALTAMFVCWFVGLGVGMVAQSVVDQRIEAHKAAHPMPGDGLPHADDATNGSNVIIEEDGTKPAGSTDVAGKISAQGIEPVRRQAS